MNEEGEEYFVVAVGKGKPVLSGEDLKQRPSQGGGSVVITDDEAAIAPPPRDVIQRLGPAFGEKAAEDKRKAQALAAEPSEVERARIFSELRTDILRRGNLRQRFVEEQAKVMLGKDPRSPEAYRWAARLSESVLTEEFGADLYDFLRYIIEKDVRPLNARSADDALDALEQWKKGHQEFTQAVKALRVITEWTPKGATEADVSILSVSPQIMQEIHLRLDSYTRLITVPSRRVLSALYEAHLYSPIYTPFALEEIDDVRGLGNPETRMGDAKSVEMTAEFAIKVRALKLHEMMGNPLGFFDAYSAPAMFTTLKGGLRRKELLAMQASIYADVYVHLGFAQMNSPGKFERLAEGVSKASTLNWANSWKGAVASGHRFSDFARVNEEEGEAAKDIDPAVAWQEVTNMMLNFTTVSADGIGKAATPNLEFSNLFDSLSQAHPERSYAHHMIEQNAELLTNEGLSITELVQERVNNARTWMENTSALASKNLSYDVPPGDTEEEIKAGMSRRAQTTIDAIMASLTTNKEYAGIMKDVDTRRRDPDIEKDAMDLELLLSRKRGREDDVAEGNLDKKGPKRIRSEASRQAFTIFSAAADKGVSSNKEDDYVRDAVRVEVLAHVEARRLYMASVLASSATADASPAFGERLDRIMEMLGYVNRDGDPSSKNTPSFSQQFTGELKSSSDIDAKRFTGSGRRLESSELPLTRVPISSAGTQKKKGGGVQNKSTVDAVKLKTDNARAERDERARLRTENKRQPKPAPMERVAPRKRPTRGRPATKEIDGVSVPVDVAPPLDERMSESYYQTFVRAPDELITQLRAEYRAAPVWQAAVVAALTVGMAAAGTFAVTTTWEPMAQLRSAFLTAINANANKTNILTESDIGDLLKRISQSEKIIKEVAVGREKMGVELARLRARTGQVQQRVMIASAAADEKLGVLSRMLTGVAARARTYLNSVNVLSYINSVAVAKNGPLVVTADETPLPTLRPMFPPEERNVSAPLCNPLESVVTIASRLGDDVPTLAPLAGRLGDGVGARVTGCQVEDSMADVMNLATNRRQRFTALRGLASTIPGEVAQQIGIMESDLNIRRSIPALTPSQVRENPPAALSALETINREARNQIAEVETVRRNMQRENVLISRLTTDIQNAWEAVVIDQIAGASGATKHASSVNNSLRELQEKWNSPGRPGQLQELDRRARSHIFSVEQSSINQFILSDTLTHEHQAQYDAITERMSSDPGTASGLLQRPTYKTDLLTAAATFGHAQGIMATTCAAIQNIPTLIANRVGTLPVVDNFAPLIKNYYVAGGSTLGADDINIAQIADGKFDDYVSKADRYLLEIGEDPDTGEREYRAKTAEEILSSQNLSRQPTKTEFVEAMQRSLEARRAIYAHEQYKRGYQNAANNGGTAATEDFRRLTKSSAWFLLSVNSLAKTILDIRFYAGVADSLGKMSVTGGVALEVTMQRLVDHTRDLRELSSRTLNDDGNFARLRSLYSAYELPGSGSLPLDHDFSMFSVQMFASLLRVISTGFARLAGLLVGVASVFDRLGTEYQQALVINAQLAALGDADSVARVELEAKLKTLPTLPVVLAKNIGDLQRRLSHMADIMDAVPNYGPVMMHYGVLGAAFGAFGVGMTAAVTAALPSWVPSGLLFGPLVQTGAEIVLGVGSLVSQGIFHAGAAAFALGGLYYLGQRGIVAVMKNKYSLGAIFLAAIGVGLGAWVAWGATGMISLSAMGMFGLRMAASLVGRLGIRPLFIHAVDKIVIWRDDRLHAKAGTAVKTKIVDKWDKKTRTFIKEEVKYSASERMRDFSPSDKFIFSGAYLLAEFGSLLAMQRLRHGIEYVAFKAEALGLKDSTTFARDERREESGKIIARIEANHKDAREIENTIIHMQSTSGYTPSEGNPLFDKDVAVGTIIGYTDSSQAELDELAQDFSHAGQWGTRMMEKMDLLTASYDDSDRLLEDLRTMSSSDRDVDTAELMEMTYGGVVAFMGMLARDAPSDSMEK